MTRIAKLKKRWLKDPKVNEAFEEMRQKTGHDKLAWRDYRDYHASSLPRKMT